MGLLTKESSVIDEIIQRGIINMRYNRGMHPKLCILTTLTIYVHVFRLHYIIKILCRWLKVNLVKSLDVIDGI
jgi:hypothetical protein